MAALIVGTDSYATLAEAETYIAANYMSTDAQRVAWDTLDDDDKNAALRQATKRLESLKWPGIKCVFNQSLSFPRDNVLLVPTRRNYHPGVYGAGVDDISGCTDVPDEIKDAQIVEALEIASPSAASAVKSASQKAAATASVRIGNFSQNFRPPGSTTSPRAVLASITAQQLIDKYFGGGYRIE